MFASAVDEQYGHRKRNNFFLNKTVKRVIQLLALGRETRLPLLMHDEKFNSRQIANKLTTCPLFYFFFQSLVELQFLEIFSLCVLFIKLLIKHEYMWA